MTGEAMSNLTQDLRFAVRNLGKQPALVLAAVLTLALGIGANTAIFSFVDSVLLTPPPFREPDKVVVAWASNPQAAKAFGVQELPLSNAIFYDWQRESRSFQSLSLLQSDSMTLTGSGEPRQLGVVRVAGDFFGATGTPAAVGRTLLPDDDAPGKPSVVVLSYDHWQRWFNGDPGVVGRKLTLGGNPMTVVGVMPRRFTFPRGNEVPAAYSFAKEPDAWVPFALPLAARQDRANRFSFVVGRLRDGVDMKAAEAELRSISDRLAVLYPDTDKGWSAFLVPITQQIAGTLLVLWAAVGFVLLIACVNVANLLLARAASRQKEIVVRTAIGASRRRLVGQLLTEVGLLSLVGGALGIALAWAGLRLAAGIIPTGAAGAASFEIDFRVLAFTLLLCLLTNLLAGLIPALQMTQPNMASALREGTRAGSGSKKSRRTRSTLVIVEIAVTVPLLIGAGLLMRSFYRLTGLDPGFRSERVLTFRLDLPPDLYPPPQRLLFYQRLIDQTASVPGTISSAVTASLPLSGSASFVNIAIEGRPAPKAGEVATAGQQMVTSRYFETMGVPLTGGRLLANSDTATSQQVAVIDQTMAKVYWPGEDPIGKRFHFGKSAAADAEHPWITVVGVVGDVRHAGLQDDARPNLYQTPPQTPTDLLPYYFWGVLRTSAAPESVMPQVRAAVNALDPDQPITDMRTLDQVIYDSLTSRRLSLILLGLFATVALLLSMVGLYGVTAYSVAQRTRELGLRIALGAHPGEVLRLVLKEAALLSAIGVGLGIVAAFAFSRSMASLLFGINSTDPLTFVGVSLGLALIALIAAYLPGRRATRVNPMVALRAD
jgi:predicted permease